MSTLGNDILDGQELLKGDFKVTFSPYWEKKELLIRRGHITLALILIVILGSITARNYGNSYFLREEVLFIILCLPIPFSFILLIQQFRKFRNRSLNEKMELNRLFRLSVFIGLFFVLSLILFLIPLVSFLLLAYSLIYGFNGETLGFMILSMPILLLTGFQTFYLARSIIYLRAYYQIKKAYV